ALLIMGFVAQYAAIGTGVILAGLSQLPRALEEAAEICGAGWFPRLLTTRVPNSVSAASAEHAGCGGINVHLLRAGFGSSALAGSSRRRYVDRPDDDRDGEGPARLGHLPLSPV